ncbi:MAG: hypothetical protein OXE42_10065 [Gammaproteobacteria bacterium]|nr:hypothetical protein [Gammaproteobacteria bacterium]
MSEIDKIKEEIGWLKVVFGLLIVTDISLLGWIARNIFNIHVLHILATVIIIVLLTEWIIVINRRVYRKLDDLLCKFGDRINSVPSKLS